jgi:hypothetical protein
MEGKAAECSVVYLFGTPRFAILPTITQLGLTGEAADQAWIAYAAGELTQAEGRLRLPRRTKPCTVVVEGDVAPSTWHAENIDEILEIAHVSSPWEGALLWRSRSELVEIMGPTFNVWQPGKYLPTEDELKKLQALASPGFGETFSLYERMGAKRRQTHEELFSWLPLDDE